MRTNPHDATVITEGTYRDDDSKRGLTKREHFAALAMQGLLASGEEASGMAIARMSAEMADVLIVVLNGGSVE